MKKTLFIVLAIFLMFSLSGVSAQEKTKKEKRQKTSMMMQKNMTKKTDSTNVYPKKLMCPVMKMEAKKDINYTYKGKKYYFCCNDCLSKFKANPEKYSKK